MYPEYSLRAFLLILIIADGIVTCLESGCNKEIINLAKRKAIDSGKSIGIGSLSTYRVRALANVLSYEVS